MDDETKPAPVAKMKWSTVMTTTDYTTARARADAVKGKVKKRPDGTFDVRVGTETKAGKTEQEEQAA